MKILCVLCFLSVFVNSQKLRDEVGQAWEEEDAPFLKVCVNETNIDPMIAKMMYRDLNLPNEESFQCYMKCIFERLNVLTTDNEVDINMLSNSPFINLQLATRCVEDNKNETNICVKVYLVTVCLVEHQYEYDE